MKIAFVAVNAKYIHTSPAVRILSKVTSRKYQSGFFEYTIKENLDYIVESLKDYNCIGLSCYIWNISIMRKLSSMLKNAYKNVIVFAGGPEVSYEPEAFISDFDYVMCGEGEETILPFLSYLNQESDNPGDSIAYKEHPQAVPAYVKDLYNVPSILDTYTEDDLKNRIIYVETSRGCPFNCSYCLSSVEKGVRFFPDEYIKELFEFITSHKFKCLKFLDRTFNVNPERFLRICKILESTPNKYQFEIEAELFNDKVINYFANEVTPFKFRLEIGVQTLNSDALKSVNRKQDNERLFDIIRTINDGKRTIIHTDLIAGLPYENLESFKNTFNKTFLLGCEELQLGFLKMLRGTEIRNDSYKYDYDFMDDAPYEVLSNNTLDNESLHIIHECENTFEWMWNDKRCIHFIQHLIEDRIITDYFEFFRNFNKYYNKNLPLHDNYRFLVNYLKELGIYKEEYLYDLKLDFLSKMMVKPMAFWKDRSRSDYFEREYDYKLLGLDESYFNSFITRYYDKYIVIKYVKGKKPELQILNL